MKITITAPGEFIVDSPDAPKEGKTYYLEDATTGTQAQNKAFHAMVSEYYKSGLWSYQGSGYQAGATEEEFRNMIKRSLGTGFSVYLYAVMENGKAIAKRAETREEIPAEIWADPDWQKIVIGKLKSWTEYTKKERTSTIDKLKTEMISVGVNTPKFHEILDGMESKNVD